jgi:hypothetical protein
MLVQSQEGEHPLRRSRKRDNDAFGAAELELLEEP